MTPQGDPPDLDKLEHHLQIASRTSYLADARGFEDAVDAVLDAAPALIAATRERNQLLIERDQLLIERNQLLIERDQLLGCFRTKETSYLADLLQQQKASDE